MKDALVLIGAPLTWVGYSIGEIQGANQGQDVAMVLPWARARC